MVSETVSQYRIETFEGPGGETAGFRVLKVQRPDGDEPQQVAELGFKETGPVMDVDPDACEAVFGGHFWREYTGNSIQFQAERACGLCGKRQVEKRRWEDTN